MTIYTISGTHLKVEAILILQHNIHLETALCPLARTARTANSSLHGGFHERRGGAGRVDAVSGVYVPRDVELGREGIQSAAGFYMIYMIYER